MQSLIYSASVPKDEGAKMKAIIFIIFIIYAFRSWRDSLTNRNSKYLLTSDEVIRSDPSHPYHLSPEIIRYWLDAFADSCDCEWG